MKREVLLKSREYWMVQIQNNLFGVIEEYMKKNGLNRSQLAKKLNVTKGYVTQVLNGDFDHKVSKLVDLSLFVGKVPILNFINTEAFITDDANDKVYEITAKPKFKWVTYSYKQMQEEEEVLEEGVAIFQIRCTREKFLEGTNAKNPA